MLRFLKAEVGPVGGIRFVDPDTNFKYDKSYTTFESLAAHVVEHRKQNKLPPIEDFRTVWENWMCHEFGMEEKCCPVSEEISRTFEQYIAGAKAYVRRIFSKHKLVDASESERRAKVCFECDQNLVNTGHTMAQFYSDRFMRHQTGGKTTSLDKKLFTCKICTCLIRSKVHYPSAEVAVSLSDTEVGRLAREPKSIRTKQKLRCWQLDALEESRE